MMPRNALRRGPDFRRPRYAFQLVRRPDRDRWHEDGLATKHESDAREAENSACKPVKRLGKVKPGGKNQLRPIPSSGKSPFGAADKSGQSGFNQISGPAGTGASKIKSNSVKATKGGGGFNTAKPGGNSAMDRLGAGGNVAPGSAAGASGARCRARRCWGCGDERR